MGSQHLRRAFNISARDSLDKTTDPDVRGINHHQIGKNFYHTGEADNQEVSICECTLQLQTLWICNPDLKLLLPFASFFCFPVFFCNPDLILTSAS